MGLYIEITNGDSVGAKFPVKEGFRLGRTTGEILVVDPKISSLHAQIEKNSTGSLVLSDRGSSNGLWVGGEKVKGVLMLPGVTFRVGRTTFQVVEIDQDLESTRVVGDHVDGEASIQKDWRSALAEEVPKLQGQNAEELYHIQAFDPPVRLDFIEGIQFEKSLVLGFGPRKFGSDVFDIELLEPESPFLAFELIPDSGLAKYSTHEYRSVLLNDRQITSDLLKEGDTIRIGKTLIRVSYIK